MRTKVSFEQDGEEKTVSVEESDWMRIPRAAQHSSEGCPDYDDFGKTLPDPKSSTVLGLLVVMLF